MRIKPWRIVLILMAGMIIPYLITLLLAKQIHAVPEEAVSSGRTVQTDSGSVDAEEYLVRLVAAQMPASYHIEALKAQAVIARTYLYQAMGGGMAADEENLREKGWTEEEMKQKWEGGVEENRKKIKQAVKETSGETITYEGNLIEPFYHPVSSGTTRTDTSGMCPYLKSKESPYDIEAEGYLQMKIFMQDEFVEALLQTYPEKQISKENVLAGIQILAKDSSSYIEQLQIGGCEFQGIQVAEALGLSSCCMSFEDYEGRIRVICRGIGHGYGMSQWGANRMGEEGSSYQDILNYYYDNILITSE